MASLALTRWVSERRKQIAYLSERHVTKEPRLDSGGRVVALPTLRHEFNVFSEPRPGKQ